TMLSASYLNALRGDNPLGILPFVQPFIVVIGVQIATLISCVAYRAAAAHVGLRVEQVAFCVVSFFFVWSALEVVAIARNLLAHAITRSAHAASEERDDAQRVRRLHGR